MLTLMTATWSADVAEDSLTAVLGADGIQVRPARDCGLALHVTALLHAVHFAHQQSLQGQDVKILAHPLAFEAREQFLSGYTTPECASKLLGLARLEATLATFGTTLTVLPGEVDPEQAEQVSDAFSKHQATVSSRRQAGPWELSGEDLTWVKANNAKVVYTDGAQNGHLAVASWGVVTDDGVTLNGVIPNVADSCWAEIEAMCQVLDMDITPALVVTDYHYSPGMASDVMKLLLSDEGKARLNRLNQAIDEGSIRLVEVTGHGVVEGNLQADRAANRALGVAISELANDPILFNQRLQEVQEVKSRVMAARKKARDLWLARSKDHKRILQSRYPDWSTRSKREKRRLAAEVYKELDELLTAAAVA